MTQLRRLIGSITPGAWGEEAIEGDAEAIPCIRAADFNYVQLRARLESAPLRKIDARVAQRIRLRRGDLILEKSGGGARTPAGRAVYFDSDSEAVCSNFAARIRPTDATDGRFLSYLLASLYSQGATESCVTQTTGIQNLDVDMWLATEVVEPQTAEQRRIADFLDDQVARIDNIVAARETQVALVKSERDALADRILVEVSEYVTSRLGLFVRRIEQGWSPQCEAVPAELGDWGVLKVSAVRPGRFFATENKRLPDALEPLQEYEVREGDLFVTRANTPSLVGAFAVAPAGTRTRLIFSDKIMRITLSDVMSPDFVGLVGQSRPVRDILSSAGTGTSQSMVNIRGSDIRDLRVPVIDRIRQQEIVALHRDEDAQLVDKSDLLARQVALVLELKQSLITAAVTGEFDVTAADGSQVPL